MMSKSDNDDDDFSIFNFLLEEKRYSLQDQDRIKRWGGWGGYDPGKEPPIPVKRLCRRYNTFKCFGVTIPVKRFFSIHRPCDFPWCLIS